VDGSGRIVRYPEVMARIGFGMCCLSEASWSCALAKTTLLNSRWRWNWKPL
jgi:hypothetical protein